MIILVSIMLFTYWGFSNSIKVQADKAVQSVIYLVAKLFPQTITKIVTGQAKL
jgi:hypothetical protein